MRQGSHAISFLWNLVPLNSCEQTFLNIPNTSNFLFLFLILLGKIIYIYDLHDNPNLFGRFLAFPIFLWLILPLCRVIKNIGMRRKPRDRVCAKALAVYILNKLRLDKSKWKLWVLKYTLTGAWESLFNTCPWISI